MSTKTSRWESITDVCAALHKHPISFGTKLKNLRESQRLTHGVHYLHTGDSPNSKILWDIEELTKFFSANQPKKEAS